MESNKPKKSKLVRTFTKVLNLRRATAVKIQEKQKDENGDLQKNRAVMEAFLAKQFATVSSLKSAYAQLQFSQSPYDFDSIQSADQMVVSEFKNLSELKQNYLKKNFDFLSQPEAALILAGIQEQRSLIKTYQVIGKSSEFQLKKKDSEIQSLKGKLEEAMIQNKLLENMLWMNQTYFITVHCHAIKSIRRFSRFIFNRMISHEWEIDKVANSIHPDVIYWKSNHTYFAFESFISREIFNFFHHPNFSVPSSPAGEKQRHQFFEEFVALKSKKSDEFLAQNPQSSFAKFCREKYLKVVVPKVEELFSGDLKQREFVTSGKFPVTMLFVAFTEMAKWVWLLHCLGNSYESQAEIFVLAKGDRFSEVYMESVTEEPLVLPENSPECYVGVAFTVIPGFRMGKTVIQSQVYLSRFQY